MAIFRRVSSRHNMRSVYRLLLIHFLTFICVSPCLDIGNMIISILTYRLTILQNWHQLLNSLQNEASCLGLNLFKWDFGDWHIIYCYVYKQTGRKLYYLILYSDFAAMRRNSRYSPTPTPRLLLPDSYSPTPTIRLLLHLNVHYISTIILALWSTQPAD